MGLPQNNSEATNPGNKPVESMELEVPGTRASRPHIPFKAGGTPAFPGLRRFGDERKRPRREVGACAGWFGSWLIGF